VHFSFCRESPAQPFSDLSPTGLMSLCVLLFIIVVGGGHGIGRWECGIGVFIYLCSGLLVN
jgi:hypothetical protein